MQGAQVWFLVKTKIKAVQCSQKIKKEKAKKKKPQIILARRQMDKYKIENQLQNNRKTLHIKMYKL